MKIRDIIKEEDSIVSKISNAISDLFSPDGDETKNTDDSKPITPPISGGLAKRKRGVQIMDVQKALVALGYNDQSNVDGIYGPKTANAVKKFQKDVGLTVDGDAGPITVRAINKALNTAGKDIELSKPEELAPRSGPRARQIAQPLATDSVTQGKVGEVLDLIAQYESGGDYNIVNGGSRLRLTDMTVAEVIREQRNWRSWRGAASSAAGRYQYIRSTLIWVTEQMGMNVERKKFDEQTQDEICIYDLRYRCELDQWLSGSISNERFLNKLSRVWAAIPNTGTGLSTYQGVANNQAGVSVGDAVARLDQIQQARA
jgi:peptidoglycan hydrolase-like protein with peptidoglycan-binding domain